MTDDNKPKSNAGRNRIPPEQHKLPRMVYLSQSECDELRSLCDGNLSAGVRMLLKFYRENNFKTKESVK